MRSTNYIVIQGWMCNELGLKGNELLVFALIYGFSQDGESKFSGGRRYISETFDISLPTVDKILQSLVAKNFINKQSANDYKHTDSYFITDWVADGVVKKLYEGSKETLSGGSKETLLSNIDNKQTNKDNSKELLLNKNSDFQFGKSKPKKENLYTKCVNLIDGKTDDAQIRSLLINWLNMLIEKYKDRDRVLYANVFKGKLNMLDKYDEKDWKEIIEYNLQRGYEGFYPLPVSNYNNYDVRKGKPWEEGVTSNPYSDDELLELRRIDDEREAQGLRTRF